MTATTPGANVTRPRWLAKLLQAVLYRAYLLVATALLLEIALRLLLPPPPLSLRKSFTQDLPGLKSRFVYTRNDFGLRSLSMTTKSKGPRVVRIICLGASTTDQPTQSTENIWSAVLERKLRAEWGTRGVGIEVAAYGRGGGTVMENLSWAEQNLVGYKPDIVITLEGVNDLAWHGGPGYTFDPAAASSSTLTAIGRSCQGLSQLCRWGVHALIQIKARWTLSRGGAVQWHSEHLALLRQEYAALPDVEAPSRNPDPIVEFAHGIARLVSVARASGAEVIVLGQPVLWKPAMTPEESRALWFHVNTASGPVRPSTAWLDGEMRRYNEVQRREAERQKAEYVPLDRLLPRNLGTFFDDCHFTDAGNVLVAEAIHPVVASVVRRVVQRRGL